MITLNINYVYMDSRKISIVKFYLAISIIIFYYLPVTFLFDSILECVAGVGGRALWNNQS